MKALVEAHGYDILGDKGYQDYRRMKQFASNVTNVLQPRSFDELVKHGWQD